MNFYDRYIIFLISMIGLINFLIPHHAEAAIEVTGRVCDSETGYAIPYVNVSIRNLSSGTITDSIGIFRIKIQDDRTINLIFSHVGYQKKTIIFTKPFTEEQLKVDLKPKVLEFPNVIISASLYEQPVQTLAKSAMIIERRQLVEHMQSNMTDMLATKPGFTQIWEYHSPLLLRGMNSKRLLVMKNGNRRIGTFPGGYFGQDMNIYGAQKVEIIKGPGSVIYGSGAISGIINLISQEPWGRPGSRLSVVSGFGSNNNELLETANACYQKEKYGIMIHGKWRKTDSFKYGDGTLAENSDVEDCDLAVTTGIKINSRHKIMVHVDYHEGDWGKPRGFNGPTKAFTEIRNKEERNHSDFSYTYSPGSWVDVVQFNAYYDSGTRDYYKTKYSTVSGIATSLDLVHYKDQYGGARLFANFKFGPSNTMTIGLDGYLFTLDNPSDVIDYYYDTQGTVAGYKNAGQKNRGVFLNDAWDITNRLRVIAGLRYDVETVDEGTGKNLVERHEDRDALSGNMGLVYAWKSNHRFSLNLGRAFRMPTAEELFTEVISCKGTKAGNPDLQPEYSFNIDIGLRGHTNKDRFTYDLALFYNRLQDYINETADTEHESVDFTYTNTDAVIRGGELSASYRFDNILRPANTLYVGLGSSHVYGVDLSKDGDNAPLFGVPPFKLAGELKYHGLLNRYYITGYSMKIQCEYAASQDRVPEIPEGSDGGPWGYIPSDSHVVWHLACGIKANSLPGSPKLQLVICNMFNLEYQPYGSYIQAMGRNIKTVLSFHLQ